MHITGKYIVITSYRDEVVGCSDMLDNMPDAATEWYERASPTHHRILTETKESRVFFVSQDMQLVDVTATAKRRNIEWMQNNGNDVPEWLLDPTAFVATEAA